MEAQVVRYEGGRQGNDRIQQAAADSPTTLARAFNKTSQHSAIHFRPKETGRKP